MSVPWDDVCEGVRCGNIAVVTGSDLFSEFGVSFLCNQFINEQAVILLKICLF